MKISEAEGKLKVGMTIEANVSTGLYHGVVTEVDEDRFRFSGTKNGRQQSDAWGCAWSGDGTVIILNESKHIMSNVLDFFRNLSATPDEKLLKELGIEDPIGTPTDLGLKLSAEITYHANRAEVIEIAKKLKAEEDAKKTA